METHRSGPLKQQNKKHKSGKHRTKGELEKLQKGKVAVIQVSRHNKIIKSKMDRKNRANQLRKTKREELISKKRSIGGERSPPHYVAIIPLSQTCCADDLLEMLCKCDDQSTNESSPRGITHVSYPKYKQRVAYMVPDVTNLAAVLESVRACDSVLFLWSLVDTMDEDGERLFSCLFAQGLPSVAHAVLGIKGLPQKKQAEVKKILSKEIEDRLTEGKLHLADTPADALNLVRFITQQKIRPVLSREMRPHIVAESLEFVENTDSSEKGSLYVTGYLRGKPLSVNRLVHIPGYGDFQMNKITAPTDPYPLVRRTNKLSKGEDEEMEVPTLATADPNRQESLQTENIPDPLDGEQTWPDDEELAEAAAKAAMDKEKRVMRVPKGTSSYQAAWIPDEARKEVNDDDSDDNDDDENDDYTDDDDEGDDDMEDIENKYSDMDDNDMDADEENGLSEDCSEAQNISGSVPHSVTWADDAKYDQLMDLNQEKIDLEKYRLERENEMFPDEVDTPEDVPASQRFARYRGLSSFRTSPWDPKENLPRDYSRIFQFENFTRYKKTVLKEELADGIVPGWYITVEVKDVPTEVYNLHKTMKGFPFLLTGLLANEQRMSVLNFLVRRNISYTEPVKSKERLIIQCGYRRFACNPIFSEHTNINKHKYERYLPQNGVCMLSVYAPIMFPPATVLVFKESGSGHDLVASGSLHSVNPDRLVIKRIVLSGHPYKINRRSAVIRYMFYSRDDIKWFQPIELKTKYGRRGHIREPLGTHGHMKCVFDNQLKSQDTVLMMLYKRVFPKWTYSSYVPPTKSISDEEMNEERDRKMLFG